MTQPLTDWRRARSHIGVGTAATAELVELDFDLGADIGLEIASVHGIINPFNITEVTTLVSPNVSMSLHQETGSVESLNREAGQADQVELDTEVFFEMLVDMKIVVDSANGHATIQSGPNSYFERYTEPLLLVTNFTHRVSVDADVTASGIVIIEYRYVRLTSNEIGLLFARRRR